ncbi:MAG: hypothetical protein DI568_12620 [Sphingomonas sp.]|nr:MAG: hypothetical protein DI568_12620 [Sphingomonas sp.]
MRLAGQSRWGPGMAIEPVNTPAIDDFLGRRPSTVWRQRLLWLLLGLTLVALVALVGRFVNGGAPTRYMTSSVVRQDLNAALQGTGTLQPADRQLVGMSESGRISAVLVRPGEQVREGQLLARLDSEPFQSEIDRASTLLANRDTALSTAREAEAKLRVQLRRYERVRAESGGMAPSNREMRVARTELRDATAKLQDAEAEADAAQRSLATQRARLAAADIRAPADGVVVAGPQNGQMVTAGQNEMPFVIAAPYSRLKLEMMVDRANADEVSVGTTTATVRATSFPARSFPARVVAIRAARSTDPSNVVLVLDVQNPDLALKPGMAASANVELGLRRNMLVVPNTALQFARAGGPTPDSSMPARAEAGEAVYVLGEGNRPRRTPVELRGSDGTLVAVVSGELEPGMPVVTGLR